MRTTPHLNPLPRERGRGGFPLPRAGEGQGEGAGDHCRRRQPVCGTDRDRLRGGGVGPVCDAVERATDLPESGSGLAQPHIHRGDLASGQAEVPGFARSILPGPANLRDRTDRQIPGQTANRRYPAVAVDGLPVGKPRQAQRLSHSMRLGRLPSRRDQILRLCVPERSNGSLGRNDSGPGRSGSVPELGISSQGRRQRMNGRNDSVP